MKETKPCETCNKIYPVIIKKCSICGVKVGLVRAYELLRPSWIVCSECGRELEEKAWKYDDLNRQEKNVKR